MEKHKSFGHFQANEDSFLSHKKTKDRFTLVFAQVICITGERTRSFKGNDDSLCFDFAFYKQSKPTFARSMMSKLMSSTTLSAQSPHCQSVSTKEDNSHALPLGDSPRTCQLAFLSVSLTPRPIAAFEKNVCGCAATSSLQPPSMLATASAETLTAWPAKPTSQSSSSRLKFLPCKKKQQLLLLLLLLLLPPQQQPPPQLPFSKPLAQRGPLQSSHLPQPWPTRLRFWTSLAPVEQSASRVPLLSL
jgi:hypothetical protein